MSGANKRACPSTRRVILLWSSEGSILGGKSCRNLKWNELIWHSEYHSFLFVQGIHESKVFKIFTGLGCNDPIHSSLTKKKVKLSES